MATFTGTSGNDTIRPSLVSAGVVVDPPGAMPSALADFQADLVLGNDGDDILEGGGNDQIYGGSGSDRVYTAFGTTYVEGEGGDDTVFLGGSFASAFGLYGGDGFDTLSLEGRTADSILNFTLTIDSFELLIGSAFADSWRPVSAPGLQRLDGRAGDDSIIASFYRSALTLVGGTGADLLIGTGLDDTIELGQVTGAGVLADLLAPAGATVRNADMTGSTGADAVGVGGRALTLDCIDGGNGTDLVKGSTLADLLVFSAPGTVVQLDVRAYGLSATARLKSVERFELGDGDDVLSLNTNAAAKYTTSVTAKGGTGNDTLWTGSGSDVLEGEDGNDFLVGGYGDDAMTGGAGADLFGISRGFGTDRITDFNPTDGDRLRIKGFGANFDTIGEVQAAAQVVGADTVLTLTPTGGGATVTLTLEGFTGTLTAANLQVIA